MKYLAILACLPMLAFAAATPYKSKLDNRIQYVRYSADNVTKINAAIGNITTIKFALGEQAKHFGSGFGSSWEFQARDNYFFLKPKDFEADTNLSIVTNYDRIYQIDISLVDNNSKATYLLTYDYPSIDKAVSNEQKRLANTNKALNQSIKRDVSYNFDYLINYGDSEDSKYLTPKLMYDDGRFTYIKFPDVTDIPSIFSVHSDGESVVNYHIADNELVIHSINKEYRFRAGENVVGIYNTKYKDALNADLDKSSGTNLKDVTREVIFDD